MIFGNTDFNARNILLATKGSEKLPLAIDMGLSLTNGHIGFYDAYGKRFLLGEITKDKSGISLILSRRNWVKLGKNGEEELLKTYSVNNLMMQDLSELYANNPQKFYDETKDIVYWWANKANRDEIELYLKGTFSDKDIDLLLKNIDDLKITYDNWGG